MDSNIDKINVSKMKKKISKRIIIFILIFILLIGIVIFRMSHNIYYKYNDWWVIGRTQEEIEERYGEFDIKDEESAKYFMYIYSDYILGVPETPYYYEILFDKSGIAYEVRIGTVMH